MGNVTSSLFSFCSHCLLRTKLSTYIFVKMRAVNNISVNLSVHMVLAYTYGVSDIVWEMTWNTCGRLDENVCNSL